MESKAEERKKYGISAYTPNDKQALFEICLQTGNDGKDATHLYQGAPELLGEVYVAPYIVFEPTLAFVLRETVSKLPVGYCVGALDSEPFYRTTWHKHFSKLYEKYAEDILRLQEKTVENYTGVEALYLNILNTREIVENKASNIRTQLFHDYPSHLHINILPRAQSLGFGKELMLSQFHKMQALGSKGCHLGLSATNTSAYSFYKRIGMSEVYRNTSAIYMVISF